MKAPDISDLGLALSVSLVFITGLVSCLFRLGLLKTLLWASFRTFVQLTLLGYVLVTIFRFDYPSVVAGMLLLMAAVAAWTGARRVESAPHRPYLLSYVSLVVSTFFVSTVVCGIIIGGEKWWSTRLVIPIAGMILGNTMNGISLTMDRLFGEVRGRIDEIETRLSLGYGPWEAIRPEVQRAVRAGLTPVINSLMVVGVVSIPGMATGQVLAGNDPHQAVRYQIVVMLMIAAAVSIGCLVQVGISFRWVFTRSGVVRPELRKSL